MVSPLVRRQLARLPALLLAVGILLLTLALRPLNDLGFRLLDLPIGIGATTFVLLADTVARDGVAPRRADRLLGCASGVLFASGLFSIALWSRYAASPFQVYGLCYATLALAAGFLAVVRPHGGSQSFWRAMIGTCLPIFCLLCLRWLVRLCDL